MTSIRPERQDDDQLAMILDDYLESLENGTAISETDLIARHPEFASQLKECLGSLQFLKHAGKLGSPDMATGNPGVPIPLNAAGAGTAYAGLLGDFQLGREIGRGGMGVVYEARQVSLDRRVALKVLPFAAVLDSRQLRRFRNEAQLAAQLHHNNIVPVHAVGSDRGVHYYAMQLIEGRTMAAAIHEFRAARGFSLAAPVEISNRAAVDERHVVCQSTAVKGDEVFADFLEDTIVLPGRDFVGDSVIVSDQGLSLKSGAAEFTASSPSAAGASTTVMAGVTTEGASRDLAWFRRMAELGVQVAQALDHAHELGIVHRDIKPSNLLLDQKGKIWVTDFGLAQIQTNPGMTMTGDLVGTLRYMSPEQAMARRVPLDHRTDIYSLGVTLYEMLALESAFPGNNRNEILRHIAFEEPRPLRRIHRNMPKELETIVMKAMMKNPSSRYATAAEMADDLQRFLNDRPILAKRPTVMERIARLTRRHQTLFTAAAVVMCVLLVVSWVSLAAIARQSQIAVDALAESKRRQKGAQEERVRAEYERSRAEKSLEQLQRSEFEKTHSLRQARFTAAELSPYTRRIGQRQVGLQAIADVAKIDQTQRPGDSEELALRNLAVSCFQIVDLIPEPVIACAHSGFGIDVGATTLVEPVVGGGLTVKTLDGSKDTMRIESDDFTRASIQVTPDRRFLICSGHVVRVWSLASGEELWNTVVDPVPYSPALSPDGSLLAIGAPDGTTAIHEVASGVKVASLGTGYTCGHCAAFSPDFKQLAVMTQDHRVSVWNLLTRERETEILAGRRLLSVAWHPKLPVVAVGTWDGLIHLFSSDTGVEISQLQGHQAGVIQLTFHPWEDLLISTAWDGTSRVWRPSTRQELLTIPRSSRHLLTSDGLRLLSAGGQGIEVWRLDPAAESQVMAPYLASEQEIHTLEFSLDSRFLVSGSHQDGLRVWDAHSAQMIGRISPEYGYNAVFHPIDGSLMSVGNGIWRRRFVHDAAGGIIRLGAPESLGASGPAEEFVSVSGDGRWLAVSTRLPETLAIDLKQPWRRRLMPAHSGLYRSSMSPEYTASGAFHGKGVAVSSVRNGTRVALLLPESSDMTSAVFSPDGKWLAVSDSNQIRILQSGTWLEQHTIKREGVEVAASMTFSRDGRFLLVTQSHRQIQVLRTSDWKTLLSLTAPESSSLEAVSMSPDNSRIAAICRRQVIRLWDLSRIRRRLSAVGLDWNDSEQSVDAGPGSSSEILAIPDTNPERLWQFEPVNSQPLVPIQIVTTESAARPAPVWADSEQQLLNLANREISALDIAISSKPDDFQSLLERARCRFWIGDRSGAGVDFNLAKTFSSEALQRNPNDMDALRVRGQCHSRFGEFSEALADLTRVLEKSPDDFWTLLERSNALQNETNKSLEDLERASDVLDFQEAAALGLEVLPTVGSLCVSAALGQDSLLKTQFQRSELQLRRALVFSSVDRLEEAMLELNQFRQLRPNHPGACNQSAWILVTGRPSERQPQRAVELARLALQSSPQYSYHWNTLGVALCQSGDYENAIPALVNSVILSHQDSRSPSSAADWFSLAICHQHMQDTEYARACFERGEDAVRRYPNLPPNVIRENEMFRAESEAVLQGRY